MAVDKGKVLAALNAKFQGKSVTKTYKESLATKWAARIENDEDIDSFIEDRSDDILEASAEADRRATTAAAKAKQEAADAISGKKPGATEEAEPDPNMPAWAKVLMDQNKALSDKVSGFEAQKSAETLSNRFLNDPRLKGVPQFMLKKSIPQSEEEFEAVVTELATEFTNFATENKLQTFGQDGPLGGKAEQAKAGKVDPDIVAFGKAQNAAVTKEK